MRETVNPYDLNDIYNWRVRTGRVPKTPVESMRQGRINKGPFKPEKFYPGVNQADLNVQPKK